MPSHPTTSRLRRLSHSRPLHAGLMLVAMLAMGGSMRTINAQDGPINIAVVDLDRVVSQSGPGQALQAKLESFQRAAQSEAEAIQQAALAIRTQMTEGRNSLSESRLVELQGELEAKQAELRRLGEDKQREGQKLQNDGLKKIEAQLEPVFVGIRDEGGYDLILNNVPGVVVMASDRVDITQVVIDRLNASSGG